MTKAVFDVLNIEYQYENDDDTDYWPYTMTVSVEHDENKHFSFTEDAIRAELESHITHQEGEPVQVVDFTAFYTGTKDPLRGNYEDFQAETFEAREKKIGGQTIVKNPNPPTRTSLKAYMKTSKGELRKIFGNPNYDGMTGNGSYNLVLGGKRVTIYDYRESGKRGMKYFNVGGDSWYAPIILAQIISAHRGEKVYAKEMSPQWLEDERRHEQVQSIDEHPDLTYEKAKRYHDYKYKSAETDLGFKEWADQEMKTHGKKESFDDWLDDELKSHGDDITLQDWGHHELDSHYERYGAEGFRTMGGRGFQIMFKNGYAISVMFGIGSYGDHYDRIGEGIDRTQDMEFLESSQAEVAVRDPNGELVYILGWASPDFVAALIPVVATGDEAEIIEFLQNREHREAEDMNWGGDPKGQLATALRNARIKAKQPKKPLKIEKLDAETSGQWEIGEQLEEAQMNAEDQNKDLLKWIEDYLWDNDKKGYQAYHAHRKSLGLNAEDKKRRKVSGVLSDPFDELSLDSGGIKRGIIGLGIVGLTILGIKKLRK